MTREQKRLRTNGLIIAALGVAFAACVWPPMYPIAKVFLAVAHWPFFDAPDVLDPSGRLLLAITGGLTTGVGVMMWVVGTDVLTVAPAAGRKVVLYAGLSWFVTDSTFSVVAGSPANAALNVIVLALMLGALDFKTRDATA